MNTCRSASLVALLLLTLSLLSVAARADQSSTTTTASLAQANEAKAREHYLAGESALKSGDMLTAVVELETAVKLKPSSEFSAKMLALAAAKLGSDGTEAYAHYMSVSDLQDQGKLDDAGKELELALKYRPGDRTPDCLSRKAAELAQLQESKKPVEAAQPKPAARNAATATTKDPAATKPAVSTSKKTASTNASSTSKSKPKTTHPKTFRPPTHRPPSPRQTWGRLSYVHSITVNGHKIPGHYTFKSPQPVKLPPPP